MPNAKRQARRLIERIHGLDERVTDLEQDRPGEAPTRRVERVAEQVAVADAIDEAAKSAPEAGGGDGSWGGGAWGAGVWGDALPQFVLAFDDPARGYDRTQYAVEEPATVFVTTIDDYESQSLEAYPYGTPSAWDFTSLVGVTSGEFALEYVGGDTYNHILSMLGDGLGDYPERGVTWRVDVTLQDEQNQLVIAWCGQSTSWVPPSYAVRIDGPDLALRLEKSTGGSFEVQDSGYPGVLNAGETMTLEIAHGTGGRIVARLFNATGTEVASAAFVDTEFAAGAFAIEGHAGAADADGPILDHPRID